MESKTTPTEAISSASAPALPSGWNSSPDVYALQYGCRDSRLTCLMKVIPLGDELLVNVMVSFDNFCDYTSHSEIVVAKIFYSSLNDLVGYIYCFSSIYSPWSFMDLIHYSHATTHLIPPAFCQAYSGEKIGISKTLPPHCTNMILTSIQGPSLLMTILVVRKF